MRRRLALHVVGVVLALPPLALAHPQGVASAQSVAIQNASGVTLGAAGTFRASSSATFMLGGGIVTLTVPAITINSVTCTPGSSCSIPVGTGTVTSVATSSPITGGTITTSGTIACATCNTVSGSSYVIDGSAPTKGGIVGGTMANMGGNTVAPFSTGSQTGAVGPVLPGSGYLRGIWTNTSASQASTASGFVLLEQAVSAGTFSSLWPPVSIPGGAAAGVYSANVTARVMQAQSIQI